MLSAVLGLSSATSGFVLSGALRAPVAQQVIQMVDVGASCTGTCKWFDSSKGFGFIAVDGEESDIFVHQSEIYSPGFRSLADGEKVEFKVSADDRTGAHSPHPPPRLASTMSIGSQSVPPPPLPQKYPSLLVLLTPRIGKLRAVEVTGPEGAYVQGAPRQEYDDGY